MGIRRIGLIRFQVAIAAGMIAVFARFTLPTRAQESDSPEEEQSSLLESTVVGDVDPADALTVSDLNIPVDQLDLKEHNIELAAPQQTINLSSSNGKTLLPTVEPIPKS